MRFSSRVLQMCLTGIAHPHGYSQGGTSISGGRGGGLGPDIKFRGKIWGKVQPSSPNKRKNLGGSVTTRRKSWERITIFGHLGLYLKYKGQNVGYLSPVFLEAKFGAPTGISEANFGAKPPTSLYESTPLGRYFTYFIQDVSVISF